MTTGSIVNRRNLLAAGGALLVVAVFATAILGGPDLIGPLIMLAVLAGIVRLSSGWLSRRMARLRLGIAWKILGTISIMGALMIAITLVNIGAMDYMHTELHEIEDVGGQRPSQVLNAVYDLEQTQHGTFFSNAPLLSILGAIIAFVLGIAIAVSVITPVRRMAEGMRRIASGDFSQPVEVENRDELGDLAHRINETAAQLALLQDSAIAAERARALKEQIIHVTFAQEEERGRISRELHDGLGPSLAAAVNRLRVAQRMIKNDPRQAEKELEEITVTLKTNIQDIRDLIHDLRPMALDQLGLQGAMQQQLDRFEKQTGVRPAAGIDPEIELNSLSELTVFRVLQECLGNIQKHARAASVEVLLRRNGEGCWLSISDDGRGFDSASATNGGSEGVGLIGMCERAELVGGNLSVDSGPGRGTCVKLTIPARQADRLETEEELGAHPSIAR
ncbi:MAG: sensor histidine kinase [Dehalococcoidia bacterium]|nr:sensor histidine kinase [Dehalococcoidia bacterium]